MLHLIQLIFAVFPVFFAPEVNRLPDFSTPHAPGREVTFPELFRLLPAHLPALVLCTVLGALLAFLVTLVSPKSYQAEAQLYISSAQNLSVSGYTELQLATDYQELLTSRTVLESVISSLNLSADTTHLAGQINIQHPEDTHILRIVVVDSSPQCAADIANALGTLASDDLAGRMGAAPPRIVEQAAAPTHAIGPGPAFRIILGGGIGLLICFAVLCLRYLQDDRILTQEDLTRCLGIAPLACIPDTSPRRIHFRKGGSR